MRCVLGNDGPHGLNTGLNLGLADGKAALSFWGSRLTGATTVATGEWVHLAWVYDKDAQVQRIYVDGALDGERPSSAPWVGAPPMRLGRSATTFYFDGQLCELRIWDRPRGADEIAATRGQRMRGLEGGLAAYFPLDEGAGVELEERIVGAPGALLAGGARVVSTLSLAAPPPTERVLGLTGSRHATLPTAPARLRDRSFTIEAWVKLSTSEGERCVLGRVEDGPRRTLCVGVQGGRAALTLDEDTVGATPIAAGLWTHLAFTYDQATGIPRVYVDGVLDATGGPQPSWIGEAEVRLGLLGDARALEGRLTELRIWDRARTRPEIQEMMRRRATGRELGLVALYPLDDYAGLGLRELIAGAPGVVDADAVAEEMDLPLAARLPVDQVDHVLELAGSDRGVLPGVKALLRDRSFTVEAWVWPAQHSADEPILGTYTGVYRKGLFLKLYHGRVFCGFFQDDTIGATVLPLRRWTHVAYVYDAAAETQRVYVNGVLDGVGTGKPSWIGDEEVQLGRWMNDFYFHGRLRELRIWDHARAGSELHEAMRARLGSGVPGLRRCYPLDQREGESIVELAEDAAGALTGGRWIADDTLALVGAGTRVLTLRGGAYGVLPGVRERITDTTFSIEAWVKLDDVAGTHALFGSTDEASQHRFRILVVDGQMKVDFNGTAAGSGLLTPGVWTHVALTYDGSNNRRIYLNGALAHFTSSFLAQPLAEVELGRAGEHTLGGAVTEVRIWDHRRSRSQVLESMHSRLVGDETGLVAYYPLDEGDGLEAHDRITGVRGQLTAGAARMIDFDLELAEPPATRVSKALVFDGSTQIALPDIAYRFRNAFTVEAWVYPTVHKQDATILGTPVDIKDKGLHLVLRDGRVWLGFYNNDTVGSTVLPLHRWTHVAFTYDMFERIQRVYVNGKLDGEGLNRHEWLGDDPVYLGRWSWSPRFFEGRMAELRIWEQARTEQEIRSTMRSSLRGNVPYLDRYLPLDGGSPGALLERVLELGPATKPNVAQPVDVLTLGVGQSATLPGVQELLHDRSFTVECWLKLDTLTGGDQAVLGVAGDVPREALALMVRNDHLFMSFFAVDTIGQGSVGTGWTHAAWVYDAEAQIQRVYRNGELDGEMSGRASWLGTGDVHLGYSHAGPTPLQGSLSEVRIWDHARSVEAIRETMKVRLTGAEPGLAALYPLGSRSARAGATLHDEVRGIAGALAGGGWKDDPTLPIGAGRRDLWIEDEGHPLTPANDHALYLGEGAYALLPGVRDHLYDRSFTVECWVKLSRRDGDLVILGNSDTWGRKGLYLGIRGERGHLGFWNCDTWGTHAPPVDEWFHIAFVYDKTFQRQQIYLNGVLDGEGLGRASWIGDDPVKISYYREGGRWLRGSVRELRVWGYARTATDLRACMHTRLSGGEIGLKALYPLDSRGGTQLLERVSGAAGWLIQGGSWVRAADLELVDGADSAAVGSSPLGHPSGGSSLGAPIGQPQVVAQAPAEIAQTLTVSVYFVELELDLGFQGALEVQPHTLSTTYTGTAAVPFPFDLDEVPFQIALSGSDWMVKLDLPDGAMVPLYDNVRSGIPSSALRGAADALLRPFLGAFGESTIILSNVAGEDADHGAYVGGFNAFTDLHLSQIPPFSLLFQALESTGLDAGALDLDVTLGVGADPRTGEFFVGMALHPTPPVTLIPGFLDFKSIGLDVRREELNVTAGAQLAFILHLGGEALQLSGGISGQSAGSVSMWGAIDAEDGAWEDPFGIKGLTIVGMGVEIGFTNDFPFIRLGVRGAATLGDGLLDASVAILLDGLDPANAIFSLESAAGIRLPALVDALTGINAGGLLDVSLTDLELYYAPVGGDIAGKHYDPGLRLGGKLNLWGFRAFVKGEFDFDGGGSLEGGFDPIVLKAGSTTFLQLTSTSGEQGPSVDVSFTSESVHAKFDGKVDVLGLFTYEIAGDLSTDGFWVQLKAGTPGLYQNAWLGLGGGKAKLSLGVSVGGSINIGGVVVGVTVGAGIQIEATTSYFKQSVTFTYGAMGRSFSATLTLWVPFQSVADVASAFASAASSIADALANALKELGEAAFNWVKANVGEAVESVGTFFVSIGADASETAKGLVNFMDATQGEAVAALGLAADESAKVLREAFSWSASATGEWLKSTYNLGSDAIESALGFAQYGAGEIEDALGDIFDWNNW
ncbi:MAG: LamG domain-containing protein [Nannocystaceae bacterium]